METSSENLPATQTTSRVLIADDQPEILDALSILLRNEGFEVQTANSPAEMLEALKAGAYDLLLMDLNYTRSTTSGREGLDLLSRIHAADDTLPVVVMTAWGSVELAVEAMQKGVADFVLKPWDNARLLQILRGQIAAGRAHRTERRLEEDERDQAREIQQALLPKTLPQVRGLEICSAWRPARHVGGDFFDVLKLGERRLALCIADVMGKGVPAALVMSNLQAAMKSAEAETSHPRQVCGRLNRLAYSLTGPGRLISLFYATLDLNTMTVTYTNAGQNAPIMVRRGGSPLRLTEGGPPLGTIEDWNYEQGEVGLEPGDRLLLFTDGLSEARGDDGEEFGEERLMGVVKENRACSAREIQTKVLEAVGWSSGRKFDDDATLITLAIG